MSLNTIIGQPLAVDLCRQWLKRNTTNPLLLYGPDGVGKRSLALEVAKALNCASPQPSPSGRGRSEATGEAKSCDSCISCKKIAAGTHPDVRVINFSWQALERKEPIEKQQSLRIETILTERHRLLQSAVEGPWKVSIIDDAHRMTADAANVLLKILEEPPAHTAIFLVTPFRDRLFGTIVSRCQPVRFRFVDRSAHMSHETIEAHRQAEMLWNSIGKESPARLLHHAGGRSKAAKPTRVEIQEQISSLLIPAARALRAGDVRAGDSVQYIQNALTQLRQNVQPALVYDYLLLRLARGASARPLQDPS